MHLKLIQAGYVVTRDAQEAARKHETSKSIS